MRSFLWGHVRIRKKSYGKELVKLAQSRKGVETSMLERQSGGLAMIAGLPSGPVAVDVVGFSRGAAVARHFVNILLESNQGREVRVAFVGFFDTVAAIGLDTTNYD